MNTSKIIALALAAAPVLASADNITIPHSFSPGTTIVSSQMNENFTAVATSIDRQAQGVAAVEGDVSAIGTGITNLEESVNLNGITLKEISSSLVAVSIQLASIDEKLAATASAAVSDQLICRGSFSTEMRCVQASAPDSIRSLLIAQIFSEGWIAVSVGGAQDAWAGYIFHK